MTPTDCNKTDAKLRAERIGMRSSLDSVVYLNGKVTCAGGAAPEMQEMSVSYHSQGGWKHP